VAKELRWTSTITATDVGHIEATHCQHFLGNDRETIEKVLFYPGDNPHVVNKIYYGKNIFFDDRIISLRTGKRLALNAEDHTRHKCGPVSSSTLPTFFGIVFQINI
jgi:hypothetical protein